MVDDLDQAFGFELAQRFAHRHPADAVFIGQRFLAQLLAIGEFSGENALAQGFGYGTGERLALDWLQGGHGGGCLRSVKRCHANVFDYTELELSDKAQN